MQALLKPASGQCFRPQILKCPASKGFGGLKINLFILLVIKVC